MMELRGVEIKRAGLGTTQEEAEQRHEADSSLSPWRGPWRLLDIPKDKIRCPFPHPWLLPRLPQRTQPLPFLLILRAQLQSHCQPEAESLHKDSSSLSL